MHDNSGWSNTDYIKQQIKRGGKMLKDLLYENGQMSLTRVISLMGFLAFLLVSFYQTYNGTLDYITFATICGGGGIAGQTVNKFINSKYNSVAGGYAESGSKKEE